MAKKIKKEKSNDTKRLERMIDSFLVLKKAGLDDKDIMTLLKMKGNK